jgi:hypothetical protein
VAPGTGGPPGGSGGASHGFAATPGDATWTYNSFNTSTWTTPGGDYVATPSATQSANINPQYVTWSSAGMVSDVQGWVKNPTTNFGWMIVGDESTNGTSRLFVSSESPHTAYRPALTIVYDVPTIGTQPANATIDNGQSDTLSVTAANGTPGYTYQWYTGTSGVTTNPINGATNPSYVASPTSTTSYWAQVTDSAGASTDSSTATVTVNPPITLTSTTQTVVATSFFDSGVYEFDGNTGALLKTLVAPNSQSVLSGPSGMTVGPDGNLYFASENNGSIVEYNFNTQSLSTFITALQLGAVGGPSDPSGLAFGPDGDLYVSLNNGQQAFSGGAVVRFDLSSSGQLAFSGAYAVLDHSLVQPTEMAFGVNGGDTGNLYVSDAGTDTVVKITGATGVSPSSGTFVAAGSGGLSYPSGLTWSGGKLYVTDLGAVAPYQGQVLAYNADGSFSSVFTQPGGALQFQFPSDALFLPDGTLLTADLGPTYPAGTPGVPPQLAIGTSGSISAFGPTGTYSAGLSARAFPANPVTGVTNFSPSQLALDTTAPSGSTAALAQDTVGVAYNQTITPNGGTGAVILTDNVTNAVAGLNVVGSGTGSLSITGTPTAAGTETFTVTATDAAGGTTTITYTITVNGAVTLNPSTTSLPADTFNVAYPNQTITANGGTGNLTLAVSNIQHAVAGLSISGSGTSNVSITGTPTAAGTETFTVTATDALGATTKATYSITVNKANQTINFAQPTSPIIFAPNQMVALNATGGGSGNAVVFTIDASSTGSGTISGSTLTVTGAGSIVLDANQAGNGNYNAAPQARLTLTVNKASPSISATPGAPVVLNTGMSLTDSVTLSGGQNLTGSITFTLLSPSNAVVYTDTVTVTGNGTYNTSMGTSAGSAVPTLAGTYQWVATYSGDGNNNSIGTNPGTTPESVLVGGATPALVLGQDGLLWLEAPDWMQTGQRTLVDGNVKGFELSSDGTVFVLGTNGMLWQEAPDWAATTGTRNLVDANVQAFALGQNGAVYVLGTNGVLWQETANWTTTMQRMQIDTNIARFEVGPGNVVYAVDLKGNLNFESAGGPVFVDSAVADFQIGPNGAVYVLGTDGNLWLEAPGWQNRGRTFIDGTVRSFAVEPDGSVLVVGSDHNLWLEGPGWQKTGRTPVDSNVAAIAVSVNDQIFVEGQNGFLLEELPGWQTFGRSLLDSGVKDFGPG